MSFKFLNESIITNKPIKTDYELMIECITESVKVDTYVEMLKESNDESFFRRIINAIKKFFSDVWKFIRRLLGIKNVEVDKAHEEFMARMQKRAEEMHAEKERLYREFEETMNKANKKAKEDAETKIKNTEKIKKVDPNKYQHVQNVPNEEETIITNYKNKLEHGIRNVFYIKGLIHEYIDLLYYYEKDDKKEVDVIIKSIATSELINYVEKMSLEIREKLFDNWLKTLGDDSEKVLNILLKHKVTFFPPIVTLQNYITECNGLVILIERTLNIESDELQATNKKLLNRLNEITSKFTSIVHDIQKRVVKKGW